MRIALLTFGFAVALLLVTDAASQQDDKPQPSAFQSNKKGFEDLPTDMDQWRRVSGIAKNKQLAPRDPWSFDKDGVLSYEGGQIAEMLLFTGGKSKTIGNGIFHVEWRYKKAPPKKTATGGPVVRAALNGTVYHQALAGNDNGGFFFGPTTIKDAPGQIPASNKQKGPNRILPAGEWNLYEITFQGKTISLFNNGYITAEWPLCEVERGYIGLRGDGYPIEFRNMKFKRLR